MNTVMNLLVMYKVGNYLTSLAIVSLLRSIILNCFLETLIRRDNLENLDIGGKIILRLMLQAQLCSCRVS
jgi:hypothetical protein